MQWYSEKRITKTAPRHSDREQGSGWSVTMTAISSGNCMQDILLQLLPTSITLAQRYEGGCEFQRSYYQL